MSFPSILRTSLLALALAAPGAAQGDEYTALNLGLAPGSSVTVALGMNDLGQVVGRAYFSSANTWRAFVWSETSGFTVLPQPPGMTSYRATGITDTGLIVGDGGSDGGQAWRFENGAYEIIPTLPGTFVGTANGVTQAGDVAGASRDPSFTGPWYSFLDVVGQGIQQILSQESQGFDVNDARQVVGYTKSNRAYRVTPGVGELILPALGSRALTWAWGVDSVGRVIGQAAFSNGNGHVPFRFTDSGGMQELGGFGGQAQAVDLNDRREVVGNLDLSGGGMPWIWNEAQGIRFLGNLVDTGSTNLLTAVAINDAGQVLARGYGAGGFRDHLLTPTAPPCKMSSYCATSPNTAGSGALISSDGMPSLAQNDFHLVAGGLPPGQFGLFFYGSSAVQEPFGDGRLCIAGPVFRLSGPPQAAGPEGRVIRQLDFTAAPAASGPGMIASGSTWLFQFWYRDPAGGPAGFNLSDGMSVTFCD